MRYFKGVWILIYKTAYYDVESDWESDFMEDTQGDETGSLIESTQ